MAGRHTFDRLRAGLSAEALGSAMRRLMMQYGTKACIAVWVIWVAMVGTSGYLFVYGSGFFTPFICGCIVAILLYVLRRCHRLTYGLLEFLAGVLPWANAIYAGSGRGAFSPAFSAAFDRFDIRTIVLQSYGGLFILVRGLDNICEGWAELRKRQR